jgi:hypothetical protein
MSTDILQYLKSPDTNHFEGDYSPNTLKLKRYLSVTQPLMLVTCLAWYIVYWWVDRKQHVKALKAKIDKMEGWKIKNRLVPIVGK